MCKGALGRQKLCKTTIPETSVAAHPLDFFVPNDIYSVQVTATKPSSVQVRVLLDESVSERVWQITSDEGFILVDPINEGKKIVIEACSLSLVFKNHHIYINNKRLTRDDVVIKAVKGNLCFNKNSYDGSFYIVCKPEKFMIINCLDLEDYICSVLHFESWPGWPSEVNKVLAIAARTYVVAMIQEAAARNRLYHVKNSVVHQVYAGTHNDKNIHDVVEQTRGIIMTYANKPIIAMYHACCGGIVPVHMLGIDFKKAPYLARKVPCKYCNRCKAYEWKVEFSKNDLAKFLKPYIPNISTLVSIQVLKKDRAGLVKEVSVKGRHGITALSGRIISKLPRIKSFYYTIQTTPKKIIFRGRGFGNHAGLCQWGAREMVRDGFDYKKVLRFFYPGITFMKLVPAKS